MNTKRFFLRLLITVCAVSCPKVMYGGTTQYWQYNIHLATSPTGIGKVYVINQEKTYENSFSAVNKSSSMDFSIEYQDSLAGYIFLGWSEDEPATKPSDIFTKQNPYYFSLNGFDAGKHEGAPSIDSDLKTDFYANFTSLIVESQNKDEGSAVILDSPFQVSLGTEVRIKAIAEAGYKFVGWRRTNVSGVVQEGFASTDNPYCFTTSVETAGTYTAIFEETRRSLPILLPQKMPIMAISLPTMKRPRHAKPST